MTIRHNKAWYSTIRIIELRQCNGTAFHSRSGKRNAEGALSLLRAARAQGAGAQENAQIIPSTAAPALRLLYLRNIRSCSVRT